ncbi:hypothetical protein ABZV67_40030 [Streptomyces sp. NPDC005065]|uniref:hypothetical protein n=1 Tax=unclassified Streptomyces TaxID=2593676 RepID=UPI0033B7D55E
MTQYQRPVALLADRLNEALADHFVVQHCDGTNCGELLAAAALVVRRATTVDAEVLAAAPRQAESVVESLRLTFDGRPVQDAVDLKSLTEPA